MKNGQPKTVLLSGDNGIGKTCLLNEFIDKTRSFNCQSIYLKSFNFSTVKEFYQAIVFALEQECEEIINNILLKINSIYDEKLNWKESDLKNALNIVKLQSSVTPNITSEHISKSIKSSMKLFSRIKPELDGSIDVLSELLMDPWIIIASNFTNPADEVFSATRSLARTENDSLNSSEIPDDFYKDQLLRLLYYINNHIKQKNTAFIIAIDALDNVVHLNNENRESLKNFLSDILEELNKKMDLYIMIIVACNTEQQSKVLGGNLYTNFTNKLLFSPLEKEQSLRLVHNTLESNKINISGNIVNYCSDYCEGSPFWIDRCVGFVNIAAKTVNIKKIDEGFLNQFLPGNVTEILKSQFSLLCSNFSGNPEFVDIIAKTFIYCDEPFSIFKISKATGINESSCTEIFQEFVNYGFLTSSTGEGYYYTHDMIKEFLIKQYKNSEYYNSTLLNLLKLLSIVHKQVLAGEDPSATVIYLKELCENSKQTKMIEKLLKIFELAVTVKDTNIKLAAISGINAMAMPESINYLIKLSNDVDVNVRAASLNVLEKLIITVGSNESYLENIITALKTIMFDKELSLRLKAIDIIGNIPIKASSDALITLLKDKDENVRALSLKYLGKVLTQEHYYMFLEKMTDPSPRVRVIAAEQLAKHRTRQNIQVLCSGLEDSDKNVRKACAKALGILKYNETAISLINALDDPDEDVKMTIIKSLGNLQNRRAVPYLKDILLKSDNDVIHWVATRALGNIPCKESLEILNKTAESQNSIVRHAALCSIQRINTSVN
ncbi:MAG: HEAT repeat domain-containing protein [Cyanobacteriota bacterium]